MPKIASSMYSDEIMNVLAMKWFVYRKYSRAYSRHVINKNKNWNLISLPVSVSVCSFFCVEKNCLVCRNRKSDICDRAKAISRKHNTNMPVTKLSFWKVYGIGSPDVPIRSVFSSGWYIVLFEKKFSL